MGRGDSAFALRDYGVTSLPFCYVVMAWRVRLCAIWLRCDKSIIRLFLDALVLFGKFQVENCAKSKMAKSGWDWRIEPLA